VDPRAGRGDGDGDAVTAPYREGPARLACPRCGELLEDARGAHTCTRCGGTWIAQATIESAIGDEVWPRGNSLWWRNALACPVCAGAGRDATMNALGIDDFVVDRCAEHGVWLDDGELARVLRDDDALARRLRHLLPVERPPRAAVAPPPAAMPAALTELELDRADTESRLGRLEDRRAELRRELRDVESRIANERARLRAIEADAAERDWPSE
jgi:Zn-finger nucleic acid-binding protein